MNPETVQIKEAPKLQNLMPSQKLIQFPTHTKKKLVTKYQDNN
jgi:hypothetical protein